MDKQGRILFTLENNKWLPSKLFKDPDLLRATIKLMRDVFTFSGSSVEEFEKGTVFLSYCKGTGWKNFSMKMETEYSWMYQTGFPFKVKAMICADAGVIMRTIVKLCRVFLSKKMQERIHLVNDTQAVSQLADPSSLPPPHGSMNIEKSTELFKKRMEKYKAFEASFKL